MTTFRTIVLALVQGVTEFLPISSSAHLILAPVLFGWPDQGLHFDVAANTGTLLAVMLYFRRDLLSLGAATLGSLRLGPAKLVRGVLRNPGSDPRGAVESTLSFEARLGWFLLAASVPVGLCGLLFYDQIGTVLRNPRVLATTSIAFGLLLYWADRFGPRGRDLETLGWKDTLIVGLAQALALIPGTSRSGVTMTAGLFAGFDRVAATRFAFLLAVPVGILAAAKDLLELVQAPPVSSELAQIGLGLVVSGAAAYLTIGWLLAWVRRQTMTVFVVYRVILGVTILIFAG